MGGQSKPQNTTQTTKAEIPSFLQPYLQTQANVGQAALTGLQNTLSNGLPNQQVAGFTPQQLQSHQMLQNQIASGPGQAQGMLQNAMANPNGVYQNSLDGLKNIGRGGFIDRMMPTFNGGIEQAINGQFVPSSASGTLDSFAQNQFQLDPAAQQALQQSASGGNLYGTPAFDQAVQASMRAAQPMIASTFSGAGSGGLKSGLAQIGMQQAASDSFARLYGNERALQQQAAGQLGQFGLAGRDQQIGAASQRGNLALGEQGLRTQATLGLGGLMSQERGRQLQALQTAPGIGLMGLESLNGMENQNQNRQMQQLLALNGMGNQNQAQQQAVLDAQRMNEMNPILAQQMLLQATQGMPIGQMMGQTSTGAQDMYRNRGAGILGGASAGLGLGMLTAAPGATGLAALGGPLGLGLAAGGAMLGLL